MSSDSIRAGPPQPVSPSCQRCSFSHRHLVQRSTSALNYHASGSARTSPPANTEQIPATQMHGPQERFICSTQGMQNILSTHLGGSCTLSRRAAARFRLPARTPQPPRSSHRVDPYLHSAHWFCIRRPRTRVPVYKSKWVAAVLRVEGVQATGTASQRSTQSAIERRAVFGKEWRPNIHERRGVGSGQWKTNTQTDADVLTAAEARCENKTGRAEEKLVNKPQSVRLVAPVRRNLLEQSWANREVTGSSRVILF